MICRCRTLLPPKGQFQAIPGRLNGRRKPKLSARSQRSCHHLIASAHLSTRSCAWFRVFHRQNTLDLCAPDSVGRTLGQTRDVPRCSLAPRGAMPSEGRRKRSNECLARADHSLSSRTLNLSI